MFFFFTLAVMPVLLIAAMLAVDVTRVYLAARQMTNTAEVASLAGAMQLYPSSTRVNPAEATRVVNEMINSARTSDASDLASNVTVTGVQVTDVSVPGGYFTASRVRVGLRYRVTGLLFYPVLAFFTKANTQLPNTITYDVARTATVCVPGDAGSDLTAGSCQRPVADPA